MQLVKEAVDITKHFESCLLTSYQKKNDVPTIGWGSTYYKNGNRVKLGDTITQTEADDLLMFIMNQTASTVKTLVKSNVSDNMFSALVDFAYNLGTDKLRKSTLLKKVNTNPLDVSIRDEFMKWVYQAGIILPGLVKRRKADADLYFTS